MIDHQRTISIDEAPFAIGTHRCNAAGKALCLIIFRLDGYVSVICRKTPFAVLAKGKTAASVQIDRIRIQCSRCVRAAH